MKKKTSEELETFSGQQSGTQKMTARLKKIYEDATPEAYYNLNIARAELAKKQFAVSKDNNEKLQLLYKYATELVNGGKTKEALPQIQELLRVTGNKGTEVNENNKPIYDLLAIAYMRLGEQDNCIVHHTGASCIIPLSEDGLHQIKTGSANAVEIYERILKKFPDDYCSQWLLNVAYMTLDEYPQKVPAKYRLPELSFASRGKIKRFENIASSLGIDMDAHAGGSCVEDFNEDGYLDIMASGMGLTDQIRFYVNNGNGTFTDKTSKAGLTGLVGGLNINHADYNNDGYPDVLILRGGWLGKSGNHPNSLLKNNGDGTFEDVTVAAGIYSEHPTQTACWADFNLDGYLDLFIGNESDTSEGYRYTNPCEFYLNNGNGTFTDVAQKLGLNLVSYVKGCVWGDVDNNGLPDLYISCVMGDNKLYMNRGGTNLNDWKFEEASAKSGVQKPFFSFPTWFFDYDNDGWNDIFVCGYDMRRFNNVAEDEVISLKGMKPLAELPRLYHNNHDGTYTDVTKQSGVSRVMYGMGANFEDINNDGYLDFYVGTGVPDFRGIVPNRMFLNQNGKSFIDITSEGGFGHIQKGHGVGFGDLDNDGDMDIYCVIGGAFEGDNFRNSMFNNPGNNNHWVVLKLMGKESNHDAIGAVVHLTVMEKGKQRSIFRTVGTGGSFGSSSLQLEIGLGEATIINSIEVKWPNAKHLVQNFINVEAGKKYLLKEGGELSPVEYKTFQWKLKETPHHHM